MEDCEKSVPSMIPLLKHTFSILRGALRCWSNGQGNISPPELNVKVIIVNETVATVRGRMKSEFVYLNEMEEEMNFVI